MTKSILKFSLLSLLTLAVAGLQGGVQAQDSQTPPPPKREVKGKKAGTIPFHGKLKAVDSTAKTITVGELSIQITSETKITKAGNAATLAEGVVGEEISGAYKKTEDGKLHATKIHFGPKESTGHSKKAETQTAQ
jgi:hypothetical protein